MNVLATSLFTTRCAEPIPILNPSRSSILVISSYTPGSSAYQQPPLRSSEMDMSPGPSTATTSRRESGSSALPLEDGRRAGVVETQVGRSQLVREIACRIFLNSVET